MRVCRLWSVVVLRAGCAWLAVLVAVLFSGGFWGAGAASALPLHRVGPATGGEPGLARAPAGLRAAVSRTLRLSAPRVGSGLHETKLAVSDTDAHDEYGYSVAISDSTAVVGAPFKNSHAGAVYVFERTGTKWTQRGKLTASNAAPGDFFGDSVAISGSTAVVGAPGQNSSTGAAYVFERTGTKWTQRAKLTASNAAPGDFFGDTVAISDSTAVVGAPLKNSSTGGAYVFERTGTAWSQQARLTDPDAAHGDFFGSSVAISGSTAVVGAPRKDSLTGAAYVFERTGTAWSQQARLTDPDAAQGDFFGSSVAISGSTAVVGAPRKDSLTGAAYVFERTGTAWSQQGKLTDPHAAADDFFGSSVAISGSAAVIGAPGNNSRAGAAYVFERTGTEWSQQAKLSPSHPAAGEEVGSSVAISGSTAVIGAPDKNSRAGDAYAFERSGTAWSQHGTPTTSGAAALGWSVAISGSTAVIGAPDKDSRAGDAYVFERAGTEWSQQAKLTASHPAAGEGFGDSVAITGSTALIGAPREGAGAAYVFERAGTEWSRQAKLTASHPTVGEEFGHSVAISGSTALIGAPGNGAGAAYVFERTGTEWSRQAKLTASHPTVGEEFGHSVAISGSTAVIGAPDRGAGAAFLFERTGTAWTEHAKLTSSDAASGDAFGWSVAVSGSTAAVGAVGKKTFTGAVYVFERTGTAWTQHAKLTASDAAATDEFGWSVAILGSTALVGAPFEHSKAGAAYVFARSGDSWSQKAKLTASDAAEDDFFGGSVAISGSTAVVGAPRKNTLSGAAYVFPKI